MKKTIIFIVIFLIVLLVDSVTTLLKIANDKTDEQKERVQKHAKLVNDELINASDGDLNDFIVGIQSDSDVKCEEEFLTKNKELVLNNCTIKNTDTKYCYYKDTVYKCKDKKFKDLYSKIKNNTKTQEFLEFYY